MKCEGDEGEYYSIYFGEFNFDCAVAYHINTGDQIATLVDEDLDYGLVPTCRVFRLIDNSDNVEEDEKEYADWILQYDTEEYDINLRNEIFKQSGFTYRYNEDKLLKR